MRIISKTYITLFCYCCCFLFTSCSKDPPINKTRCLRLNCQQAPLSFDPRRGGDLISSSLHFLLFEGLTQADSQVQGLAKEISCTEDGLTYTFHLQKGFWSDGTPVTAADFVFAWKSLLNPVFPSPHSNLLYCVKNGKCAKEGKVPLDAVGIAALDEATLVITLEDPTPSFLERTAFCALAPVPHDHPTIDNGWATPPFTHYVTNGPFRLKRYQMGHVLILEKNPYYWNADKIFFDEIHISWISNEESVIALFEQGKLDLIGPPFTQLPADALPLLCKQYSLISTPSTLSQGLFFNCSHPIFANVNLRKAFAYAIDRPLLVAAFGHPGDEAGHGLLAPPVDIGNIDPLLVACDTTVARLFFQKGLEELGLKKEEIPPLTLLHTSGAMPHKIAEILQGFWKKAFDLSISIETAEFGVYINRMVSKDFIMGLGKWSYQFKDPINFLDRYKHRTESKNFTNWEDARFIEALNQRDCKTAEALLMDQMPVTVLFHVASTGFINPQLQGVFISPLGFFHFDRAKKVL